MSLGRGSSLPRTDVTPCGTRGRSRLLEHRFSPSLSCDGAVSVESSCWEGARDLAPKRVKLGGQLIARGKLVASPSLAAEPQFYWFWVPGHTCDTGGWVPGNKSGNQVSGKKRRKGAQRGMRGAPA